MYTFPDQTNRQFVQILMDSKLLSQTASCTGHRWRKTKDFFVFCSRKICLEFFHGFSSFVLCHLCPVHKIRCPNPHHSHPLHPFITWIYRECKVQNGLILYIGNPISVCRLISWNNILPMEHVELRWICRNMPLPSDFFEKVKFSLTYTGIPWLDKLRVKELIFLALQMSHTKIVRRSEIQMFFPNK